VAVVGLSGTSAASLSTNAVSEVVKELVGTLAAVSSASGILKRKRELAGSVSAVVEIGDYWDW
jgi:hypothetical protein